MLLQNNVFYFVRLWTIKSKSAVQNDLSSLLNVSTLQPFIVGYHMVS